MLGRLCVDGWMSGVGICSFVVLKFNIRVGDNGELVSYRFFGIRLFFFREG